MPTFRCEYDVTGDLVLPADIHELELSNSAGFTITFRNGPADDDGHATGLVVIVVGSAESIDSAQQEIRRGLAQQLDLLAFVTHSRFKIVAARRLIEWDAGKKQRQFRAFHTVDARYPPDPEFIGKYIETLDALDQAKPPEYARTALKYFRYGLLDDQPEDQFMRLWLALEIIAENSKETDRVPIVCPACNAAMKCGACGNEPTRVPMAKQAIEQLISKITGVAAPEVCKRQFTARNGLMHGRSPESIEAECKTPLDVIVNELGSLTWHAIMSTIPLGEGPPLAFGHRGGEFTKKSLVMSMLGAFDHTGDGPHPTDDKIPSVEITLMTKLRKPVDSDDNVT